jgi:phosphate transport system substrate-binding protein
LTVTYDTKVTNISMILSRSMSRWVAPASLFALTMSLTACGGGTSTPTAPTAATPGTQQAAAPAGGGLAIKGAGATAPYPLYQKWFAEYAKVNPAATIGYESVGSGAGVKQFIAETVDFGATDSALKDDEKSQVPTKRGKAVQIPSTRAICSLCL